MDRPSAASIQAMAHARWRRIGGAVLAAVALGAVAGAGAAQRAPVLVTADRDPSADQSAVWPSISGSGRYVAFVSDAYTKGGIAEEVRNVYVADLRTGKVDLASRNGDRGGDRNSFGPEVSRSGRYVAFTSAARNLAGPRPDPKPTTSYDAYVYDARRGRATLVSRQSRSDGGDPGNGKTFVNAISDDGRYVLMSTRSTNLGGPIDTRWNAYVYDIEREQVELVSRDSASSGGQGGNVASGGLAISADGRYVAFTSRATNIGPPLDPDQSYRDYVYDRRERRTIPIPRSGPDVTSMSDDGRWLGMADGAYDLKNSRWYAFRANDGVISGDGRYIVGSYRGEVTRRRIGTKRDRIVSEGADIPFADDDEYEAYRPSVSTDGRAVAFEVAYENPAGLRRDEHFVFAAMGL